MDFLNKAFAQIADLFRSMTVGARITSALLLVVVVVSLVYLFTYQVTGSGEYLFDGTPFGHQYLSRMEVALGSANVDFEVDRGRIRVPKSQKAAAMGALADGEALPPGWNDTLKQALAKDSVFTDPEQRKLRMQEALERELSLYISAMPNVDRAAVRTHSETRRGFQIGNRIVRSASVNVWPIPGQEVSEHQAAVIRDMVAPAFGMKLADVNVIDVENNRSFRGDLAEGEGAEGYKFRMLKRQDEREWKKKVSDLLSYIPGIRVEANVMLDSIQKLEKRTFKPDQKGVVTQSFSKTQNRDQQGPGTSGRPGFSSMQPGAVAAAPTRGSHSTDKGEETKESYMVGAETEMKVEAPMTPKVVRIAVNVPRSYFEQVWFTLNPTPQGEEPQKPKPQDLSAIEKQEKDKIKKQIAGLLTAENVVNRDDLVSVETFQDLAPPPMPETPMTQTMLFWLEEYWTTLGMLGLVGFSLLMLRSMIRSGAGEGTSTKKKAKAASGEIEEEDKPMEPEIEHRLMRFAKSGASLRDELSDLVREDTEAAANILRTWIGSPASK
ncbi:MAG: hypothetical protein JW818_15350 [Pirellulales bacterium]|nr:hypothetical protein [Pirellulales bacterium]